MSVLPAGRDVKITGRMVLVGMILFFGVISAVNGVFMYFALDTFPGLTDDNAYKHGIDYNKTLADGERQAALGWRTDATLKNGNVEVAFMDKTGAQLIGAEMTAVAVRPVGDPYRTEIVLKEIAPGVYVGAFVPPLQGRWKTTIEASVAGEPFRVQHELIAQP